MGDRLDRISSRSSKKERQAISNLVNQSSWVRRRQLAALQAKGIQLCPNGWVVAVRQEEVVRC
jgi:hypothetical protein